MDAKATAADCSTAPVAGIFADSSAVNITVSFTAAAAAIFCAAAVYTTTFCAAAVYTTTLCATATCTTIFFAADAFATANASTISNGTESAFVSTATVLNVM